MTLKQHKLTVTSEMIEAGVEAAEKQFWEDVSEHDVRAIYLAMHQASIPTEATGDDVAEHLMREFYVSNAYNPKAARPADNVKAAIQFAIATLSLNRVSQSVVERETCGYCNYPLPAHSEICRARAALATQPATDTRIPINEEATDLIERLRTSWTRIQELKRAEDATLEFEPIWAIINAVPEVIALLSNHKQFEQDCEAEELEAALEQSQKRERELVEALERVIAHASIYPDFEGSGAHEAARKSIDRVSNDQG